MVSTKITALHKILEMLFDAFEQYLQLANEQKICIANNDLSGLQKCNVELDKLSLFMQESESRRCYIVESLEVEVGAKLEKASDFVSVFGESAQGVQDFAEKIKQLMPHVKKASELNFNLIKSSREFIRSNMAIMLGYNSQTQDQKFQTYGKTGAIPREFKQQVSLFNRQV